MFKLRCNVNGPYESSDCLLCMYMYVCSLNPICMVLHFKVFLKCMHLKRNLTSHIAVMHAWKGTYNMTPMDYNYTFCFIIYINTAIQQQDEESRSMSPKQSALRNLRESTKKPSVTKATKNEAHKEEVAWGKTTLKLSRPAPTKNQTSTVECGEL